MSVLSNLPFNKFFALGNRGRALVRMGGAGAAGALAGGAISYGLGSDHPGRTAMIGGALGVLGGASGHLLMGGQSARRMLSQARHASGVSAKQAATWGERARRLPNLM